MQDSFRDKMLQEAYAERERLLAGIRDQLADVDAVIKALGGEPDQSFNALQATAPERVAPEPPPAEPEQPPEPAPERAPQQELLPSKWDQPVLDYLREHGPTERVALTEALGISKSMTVRLDERLTEAGLMVRKEGKLVAGGRRKAVWMLPGQEEQFFKMQGVEVRREDPEKLRQPPPKPPSEEPVRAPNGRKKADFGGRDRLPPMLQWMPSADSNMGLQSLRPVVEQERKILATLDAHGPKLANVLGDELVGRENAGAMARVSKYLRNMRETEHIEETGNTGHAPWQKAQREKTGTAAGRTSIEYRITNKGRRALQGQPPEEDEEGEQRPAIDTTPTTDTPDSTSRPSPLSEAISDAEILPDVEPTLEEVRNHAVRMEGMLFSPAQLLAQFELDWDLAITTIRLDQLADRSILEDKSPLPDLKLFQYVKPTSPGQAAEMDMKRKPGERGLGGGGGRRGSPVVGTGRQSEPSHSGAKETVRAVRKQGGEANPAPDGHWRITNSEGRSLNISGSPGNARTVLNDRTRLRRQLGFAF